MHDLLMAGIKPKISNITNSISGMFKNTNQGWIEGFQNIMSRVHTCTQHFEEWGWGR